MSDFWGNLGKRISDVAGDVGKKAEETLEVQKIKSQIRSLQRGNERDFQDIGKMIYERFKKGESIDLDYVELCEAIEKRDEEIAEHAKEIEKRK